MSQTKGLEGVLKKKQKKKKSAAILFFNCSFRCCCLIWIILGKIINNKLLPIWITKIKEKKAAAAAALSSSSTFNTIVDISFLKRMIICYCFEKFSFLISKLRNIVKEKKRKKREKRSQLPLFFSLSLFVVVRAHLDQRYLVSLLKIKIFFFYFF